MTTIFVNKIKFYYFVRLKRFSISTFGEYCIMSLSQISG